jgi:hypothetical protein
MPMSPSLKIFFPPLVVVPLLLGQEALNQDDDAGEEC